MQIALAVVYWELCPDLRSLFGMMPQTLMSQHMYESFQINMSKWYELKYQRGAMMSAHWPSWNISNNTALVAATR